MLSSFENMSLNWNPAKIKLNNIQPVKFVYETVHIVPTLPPKYEVWARPGQTCSTARVVRMK